MYYTIWFIRNNIMDIMRCEETHLQEKISYIRANGGKITRIRNIRGEDFIEF